MNKTKTFKPPENVRRAAKLGLQLRKQFNRGGTAVGVARARDLSNGRALSLSTMKRMYSYFSRHSVDSKAEGFWRGGKGFPSAGRIAWELWGGEAGYKWVVRELNKLYSFWGK